MAGAKEPKKVSKKKDAPAKKSKSKSAPAKPSGLSEEKVVDSSSEEELEQAKAPPPLPKGKDSSSSSSSADTSSESDGPEETPAPAPKKANVTPAQANGVKRKSKEASSSSGSSSEEEESSDEEVEEPQAKRAKTDTAAKQTPANEKSASTSAESTIQSIPAPKYQPPNGYKALDSLDSSRSSFSQQSLAGKQIWHITAPAKVSLESVTEFALSSLKDQTPVLRHKGIDYVLARDTNPHSTSYENVMLPGSEGYLLNGDKIAETLHLQQKIVLPNLKAKQADMNTGSQAAGDVAQAPVSEVRPQPKGLKMRYKPPGFGKGKPGIGSDSEEEEMRTTSKKNATQFPKALGAHGASDKPDSTQTPSKEKSRQKHKKRKDPYDVDVEMDDADPMKPPPSAQPQRKQKKDKHEQDGEALQRVETATSQHSAASGASHEKEKTETPEERAKRKEAKRLRKEAKKKAKEASS